MKILVTLFPNAIALTMPQILMVFLGLGAIILGLSVRFRQPPAVPRSWVVTRGKVIFSQLQSSADNRYRLCVAFRFKAKGRNVDSHPITVIVPPQPAQANRTMKRLAAGSVTRLSFDPANPENVSLDEVRSNWLEAVLAGVALVLFAFVAF